ncbi:hypothetical protein OG786_02470 [Streptomyces sp. NBC_00101]
MNHGDAPVRLPRPPGEVLVGQPAGEEFAPTPGAVTVVRWTGT